MCPHVANITFSHHPTFYINSIYHNIPFYQIRSAAAIAIVVRGHQLEPIVRSLIPKVFNMVKIL